MRIVPTLLIALTLVAGCKQAESATANSTSPIIEAVEKELPGSQFAHPLGDPQSPFFKDGKAKPPFEEATVLKLNAIILRSKASVDVFDKATKEKVTLDKAALTKLAADAEKARVDFEAEAVKLRESKIYYDKPILAGMATFVAEVEKEMKEERDR